MFTASPGKEVKPKMSYESMMIMLTFGIFLVGLIRSIIVIIRNKKR